ncbi:MAG: primosomal protein N' [Armatimonadota bacterium]|nr:primosomal protein N' [Armatimonadota bacterium]
MKESAIQQLVVDVIVDLPTALQEVFTYLLPRPLEAKVQVGSCVLVPFSGQELLGYVARRYWVDARSTRQLKPVLDVVEGSLPLDENRLALAEWLAREYRCGLAAAVRLLAPTEMVAKVQKVLRLTPLVQQQELWQAAPDSPERRLLDLLASAGGQLPEAQAKAQLGTLYPTALYRLKRRGLVEQQNVLLAASVRARMLRHVRLNLLPEQAEALAEACSVRAPAQAALLRALAVAEGEMLPMAELLRQVGVSASALKSLQSRGVVDLIDMPIARSPFGKASLPALKSPPSLTPDQEHCVQQIGQAVESGEHRSFLLFGVTGSGKTEVYLRAVALTLARGRSALLLVPEIALAAQVVESVQARFGNLVAVLHSALSAGERFDEWRRARERRARVVVGARSAVFAPLEHLGLIVLDEEHEGAYKQQEHTPRYHARTVAWQRARREGAVLLMGSATPSLETFYQAKQGVHTLLQLPTRVEGRPLPAVHVVDMREAARARGGVFSQQMAEAIAERLGRGEQVILFLNRRAYASFLLCRQCGQVVRCRRCDVSLAYHKVDGSLRCHHCDYRQSVPSRCPACGAPHIYPFGLGTQRVEEEVRSLFPEARVLRMDRDTTTRKGAHHVLLARFRAHEADVLIGTQMVAKGLDFPKVTLVGVVSADIALHIPDFRASERAFQLLTQVAGRAGRAQQPGEVVIQTFNPEHEAVRSACQHDYLRFYEQEIAHREELRYPPFSRLANILATHPEEAKAAETCQQAAQRLSEVIRAERIAAEVLGPVQAPMARLRGVWRWHCLVKCHQQESLPDLLREALEGVAPAQGGTLQVDVDPYSLL